MARQPDWFKRLDVILDVVRQAHDVEWFGRAEIQPVFECSERDSVRLLHKFGAEERDNRLSLPRSSLIAQLEAIRAGSRYAAYLGARRGVAKRLTAARAEAAARHFSVAAAPEDVTPASLESLPDSIRWRRSGSTGRFEVLYRDGSDLMEQLARFLAAAGAERHEFLAGTEPEEYGEDAAG